jgi:hypothetical protein
MPNVQGGLDQFGGVDVKGRRIFVAALGDNQNSVEVLALKSGKRVATTGRKRSACISRRERPEIGGDTGRPLQ